jgi:hypothetical protein
MRFQMTNCDPQIPHTARLKTGKPTAIVSQLIPNPNPSVELRTVVISSSKRSKNQRSSRENVSEDNGDDGLPPRQTQGNQRAASQIRRNVAVDQQPCQIKRWLAVRCAYAV